jgi:antirestriction protein ArdC
MFFGGQNLTIKKEKEMNKDKKTVYDIILDRIIDKMNDGIVPWQCPWSKLGGFPKNAVSLKEYRGINRLLLGLSGFQSNSFLTYKQCQGLGGHVKPREKGLPVVYFNFLEKPGENPDKPEETILLPLMRYYTVFNTTQCEGLPEEVYALPKKQIEFDSVSACNEVLNGFINGPEIRHNEARAFYRPNEDYINMPVPDTFRSSEEYYSTLFHELTHSTGHEKRLSRASVVDMCPFGSTNYSREELIAEIGASFLCGTTGIENKTIDNSAAYINGWLNVLKDDKGAVIVAAGQAQKAVDLILNVVWEDQKA